VICPICHNLALNLHINNNCSHGDKATIEHRTNTTIPGILITGDTQKMIQYDAIAAIVEQRSGTPLFADALRASDSPHKLLRLLALYAEFNFDFGPCIASLAAQVALQRTLFVDKNAEAFVDRSYEVASGVFDASVDEFVGRSKKRPMTHRDLAQRMVLGAARYFHIEPSTLAKMIEDERARMLPIVHRIDEGYGLGKPQNAESTFRALGFHLGQELCGDGEFNTLANAMRTQHTGLFDYLRAEKLALWITGHINVERDHFDHALASVNRAFEYCADERVDTFRQCVMDGIEEFAQVQKDFMGLLAQPAIAA
jgi:hypothetical protein